MIPLLKLKYILDQSFKNVMQSITQLDISQMNANLNQLYKIILFSNFGLIKLFMISYKLLINHYAVQSYLNMFHTHKRHVCLPQAILFTLHPYACTLRTQAVDIMMSWLSLHADNPYPRDDEKVAIVEQTGLTYSQINYWFTNARRRILPKWKVSSKFNRCCVFILLLS